MSWIEDIENYLNCLWAAFMAFMDDLPVKVVRSLVEGLIDLFALIPVPAELSRGMADLWANLDPGIIYFLSQSGIPPALALLAIGATFRVTRKIITLGRW